MAVHPLAGKPATLDMLINTPRLVSAYYTHKPDADDYEQKVSFGTSGHRGSSLKNSFNQDHILAISQAICELRKKTGITGPLYLGMDTHALSEPALSTALEVFAYNGVQVMIQKDLLPTPTPVISHAILTYNKNRGENLADGVVITPSHNPPEDGGFKYNPPQGGPADKALTSIIQNRANDLLKLGTDKIGRMDFQKALKASSTHEYDYIQPYIKDLANVVDMKAIAQAGLKIGVDPLGGSGWPYWEPMAELYGLDITVVNPVVDPTFSFMRVDRDGKIRMDCSSPYAMAGLIDLKDQFDIAFANDPDYDRHGIVTKNAGLMNPNHYLAVSCWHLFKNRKQWPESCALGKTLVSSSMLDRVAKGLNRDMVEVPVGFKWFVEGLLSGAFGFAGEESAGASFLRKDGTVWTTDKDGIIMDLLAAEITAVSGKDPGEIYEDLKQRFGDPIYERIQAPATSAQKKVFASLTPEMITASTMAGEKIQNIYTKAPGNNKSFGGLKVVTENGWFAARPSGTEEIYKIYTESFKGQNHLFAIQQEAKDIVAKAFARKGV